MNSLYSPTKINSINDSAQVLVNGKYEGQVMNMVDLRELLANKDEKIEWVRKVLVKGQVVEKSMVFDRAVLVDFANNCLSEYVFGQFSQSEMCRSLFA